MGREELPRVFLRKASGVVRNVGTLDVFFYNIGLINIGIGIAYMILLGPAFYSGVSMTLSTIFVSIGCILQALTYYFFSVCMPRSGGDYVFISRALHPALGFVLGLSMTVWLLFYSAWSGAAMANLGFASFFSILGQRLQSTVLSNFALWATSSNGMFVIGTIMIVASGLLLISGTKNYIRVNNFFMVIALIGTFLMLALLVGSSRSDFINAFNAYAGNFTYQDVIEKAKATGWSPTGSASLLTFLSYSIWPFYPLAFSIMSCSFAGEIKKVERSQLIGMPGAVAFCGAVFVALILAAERTIGYDFMGAIAWNYYYNPDYSTRVIPWIGLLSSMLTSNILISSIINFSFVMWTFFWIPGCMIYATRVILAFALDRLTPEVLGYVSDRFNTPVVASVLSMLIAEIFMVLFAYTTLLQTLVGIAAIVVTFVFIGISAMVFPFTKSKIFEASPVSYKIRGIPLMSILGLLTTIFMGVMLYPFFTDQLGGAYTFAARASIMIIFVLGFVIFYTAKYFRKAQGIDITLAYKEIPVE